MPAYLSSILFGRQCSNNNFIALWYFQSSLVTLHEIVCDLRSKPSLHFVCTQCAKCHQSSIMYNMNVFTHH